MSSSKCRFMKKISFTALAMTFAFPAFAADANPVTVGTSGSFKFYGNLDNGIEVVNNVGATKNTVVRVPTTTGSTPSNLGIDLSKDVGSGFKAVGKAEMGFYIDTAVSGQAGKLFGRQLYVGIDSEYGAITVGRQNTMLYWGLQAGDLLGPNIYGLGSIDPYVPNARADNAVAWRGKFGGFSLGALFSTGRDGTSGALTSSAGTVPQSGNCNGEHPTNVQECREYSLGARYDDQDKKFGIALAGDRLNGGFGATYGFNNGVGGPGTALTNSSDTDTRTTLNGYYKLDALRLGVGVLDRKVKTAAASVKQDTTWLQADYTIEKWVLAGGYFHVSNNDQNTGANFLALRGIYNFDDQLSTYLTLGHMDNTATSGYSASGGGAFANQAWSGPTAVASTVAGVKQTGTMLGVRYRF
jgi:predicted porin